MGDAVSCALVLAHLRLEVTFCQQLHLAKLVMEYKNHKH